MPAELRAGEVPIDVPLVRRLIAAQFPQWAQLPVVPVAKSGWDNETFRLGDDMSVRLPRFPWWAGQVTREQRWLPWLAQQLGRTRVPVPLGQGAPGEGYPFPWSVYRWLPGENLVLEQLPDPRRAAMDLAFFFTSLQSLDTGGGPPPEPSNGFRGSPLSDDRGSPVVPTRIRAAIAALQGLADTDALTAVYETGLAAPVNDVPLWIHGDPAPGNLLWNDGRLSAVIDFGTLAIGDPACDLIVAWTFLDTATRELFRAELGTDDATWARGRVWGMPLPSPEELTDPVRGAEVRRRLDDVIADHRRYG